MAEKEKKSSIVPDFMKKAISGSVKSILSTEETIRSIIKEVFPVEISSYIKELLNTTKNEALKIVGEQVKNFLDGLDVDEVLKTFVENYKINVSITIGFTRRKEKEKETAHPVKQRKSKK